MALIKVNWFQNLYHICHKSSASCIIYHFSFLWFYSPTGYEQYHFLLHGAFLMLLKYTTLCVILKCLSCTFFHPPGCRTFDRISLCASFIAAATFQAFLILTMMHGSFSGGVTDSLIEKHFLYWLDDQFPFLLIHHSFHFLYPHCLNL